MEVTADNKPTRKDKRKALRELSKIAKLRMQADCEGMSVNEILIEEFYTDENNQVFKTFHDWKKEGFSVNKGATAFLIWGKPRAINQEQPQNQEKDEDEDEFFPICYLFSNAHVKKTDVKA